MFVMASIERETQFSQRLGLKTHFIQNKILFKATTFIINAQYFQQLKLNKIRNFVEKNHFVKILDIKQLFSFPGLLIVEFGVMQPFVHKSLFHHNLNYTSYPKLHSFHFGPFCPCPLSNDGGPSGGSSVRRPVSEDPHRR